MNPNDMNTSSMLEQIQQLYGMLQQKKAQEEQMGVNPQITAGQGAVDLARVQAAKGILNQQNQPNSVPQNYVQDPNSANLGMLNQLIQQGPQQVAMSATGDPWSRIGQEGQQQRLTNQWMNNIDQLKFRANLDTKLLTPEEIQKRDLAMQQAPLDAASGILNQTKPQTGVSDQSLLGAADLAQKNVASKNTQEAQVFAAQKQFDANIDKNAKDLAAKKIEVQGDIDKERAKHGFATEELTKTTKAQLEQKIVKSQAMLAQMGTVATNFKEDFFTSKGRAEFWALTNAEKLGKTLSKEQKQYVTEFAAFKSQVKDIFNQYRIIVTGAAAGEKEMADLEDSIFNISNSPTEAKSRLVDLMTKWEYESLMAAKTVYAGLEKGQAIKFDSDDFKNNFSKMLDSEEGTKIRDNVRKAILEKYPQLNPNPDMKAPDQKENPAIQAAKARGFVLMPNGQWAKGGASNGSQ